MKKITKHAAIILFSVSLAVMATGCSKEKVKTDEAVAKKEVTTAVAPAPSSQAPAPARESLDARPVAVMAGNILEGRTTGPMLPVYYDFDKANVRPDQQGRLEKNAAFLNSNAAVIRIEGNCDERGTNEYNMALGERRALSAQKYLSNLGVAFERMQTISYGEEKPLLHGHDEVSWAQNRRADFVVAQ